ncbi:MAG: GNAT family N-acetyltransferase [Cytophagaceae bacterium]|jgi:ribosomal protein S18 acetylase RimI-like enzyme|nr:GNAT family N-acetyltransferase [Cytophagaceae bacterium]
MTSQNYTITIATLDDLDDLLEIEGLCFESDWFSFNQLANLITKPKGVFYVVKHNESAIAYMSLVYRKGVDTVRIYSIAVHPGYRGQNIAKTLIGIAKQYAIDNGYAGLSLEVKITNEPALALYHKMGFVEVAVKPFYYMDGSNAYKMEMRIN